MEFNQKLQELRRQKGITQEELAKELYVSRTAISKWESGRGYPSIDSLKAIAKFFSVTVDELLSSSEAIVIAEENEKQKERTLRDLIYGLIDISVLLLVFLPIFAERNSEMINSASLISLNKVSAYLKISYFVIVFALSIYGILELAMQNVKLKFWVKSKNLISIGLSAFAVLLFTMSLQPYPALYVFILLSIKAVIQIIRK